MMLKYIFNFIIASYPILSAYKSFLGGVDLGSVLIFIFGTLYCFNKPLKLPHNIFGYWLFFLISLLCSILSSGAIPLWLIMYSINFVFSVSYAKLDILLKYYSYLVYASILFFLFQEFSFQILGWRISGFIPGLPLVYGDDGGLGYTQVLLEAERSASFFLEPSYLAQFIYPYIAFLVFSNNTKNLKIAIVLSVLLLFVKSGIGTFLLMIIWGAWFLTSRMVRKKKFSIVIGGFFVLGLIVMISPDAINYLTSRTEELRFNTVQAGDWASSGFIRFYRGYLIYADMPMLNKIIGAPIELIEYVRDKNPFYFIEKNKSFLNGIQMLLLYYGIIACIIYLRHIIKFANRSKNPLVWTLVVCTLFLLFSESYLLTSRIFVVTTLLYLIRKSGLNENTIYYK